MKYEDCSSPESKKQEGLWEFSRLKIYEKWPPEIRMLVYQKNTAILPSSVEYSFEVCDHELRVKTVYLHGFSIVTLSCLNEGMEKWMVGLR